MKRIKSIMFLLAFFLIACSKSEPPKPVPALPDISRNKDATEAYVGAQILIEANLTAPSTAKWPPLGEAKAIYNESSDQWTVVAYVDSQNGFGATVRTQFIAVLNYLGNNDWGLAEFTKTN